MQKPGGGLYELAENKTSYVRFLYSLGFVLEQNRLTCITLKVLSPWDSNIVDCSTELGMIFASCTFTRQVQCINVLAFIEGDQSGNQQAQMSTCLFMFCRFYMVDLKLSYRSSYLKRYKVKKLRKMLK